MLSDIPSLTNLVSSEDGIKIRFVHLTESRSNREKLQGDRFQTNMRKNVLAIRSVQQSNGLTTKSEFPITRCVQKEAEYPLCQVISEETVVL